MPFATFEELTAKQESPLVWRQQHYVSHQSPRKKKRSLKPLWAAQSFGDLDEDVRESVARIHDSPFIPFTDQVRGFVFDVATGLLREVEPTPAQQAA